FGEVAPLSAVRVQGRPKDTRTAPRTRIRQAVPTANGSDYSVRVAALTRECVWPVRPLHQPASALKQLSRVPKAGRFCESKHEEPDRRIAVPFSFPRVTRDRKTTDYGPTK